ncbi:YciI family protein [Antrihabitans cavernicola]|uniref:YCII-related domain-containing protein n=1 Tax=Antrihabitans cavernicola TaxID=2495913 RepID=A0A5A7SBI2_9NOCA|nr:YciI family protein [Spelaeibacter cavernicola]KAA0023500.1 hypothetical protein FOY51_08855 [Spelaeibacter cavernicola]
MRHMIVFKVDEYYDNTNPPPPEFVAKMGAYMDQANKAGVLLATDGLKHPRTGTRITVTNGERKVTDGPYAEAKEVIAGFVMVDVRSPEEAVEWASRFADIFDDVEVEVRPIMELQDLEPKDLEPQDFEPHT